VSDLGTQRATIGSSLSFSYPLGNRAANTPCSNRICCQTGAHRPA
jgi:hypothetical protein